MPFIKIIFCYDNLFAAILKMMLSPKSTLDVRMDLSLPES